MHVLTLLPTRHNGRRAVHLPSSLASFVMGIVCKVKLGIQWVCNKHASLLLWGFTW